MARNEERRVQVHRQMPASPGIIVTPGEDRSSHNRHLKILKWECRSVRPNKQVHYMPHLSFIYQFNLQVHSAITQLRCFPPAHRHKEARSCWCAVFSSLPFMHASMLLCQSPKPAIFFLFVIFMTGLEESS